MQTALPLAPADAQDGWHTQPLLSLDFETTGSDPLTCRPVSASLLLVNPDGTVGEDNSMRVLVKTGAPIEAGAAAVHGITLERLEEEGEPAADVIADLLFALDAAFLEEVPLVIFNAPFDWRLLLAEAKRHDVNPATVPRPMFLDPLVLERAFAKARKNNLSACCERHGVALDDAHDASADALAAALLVRAQANRWKLLRETSLYRLQLEQARWHREQQVQTNQWLRRTGRRTEHHGWPA